ncbi:MAG: PAS domain-containing protein [Proteobacteria bacterium]|nr:PAS domain-containing protein [Pseudomonadota bacterium]MDA1023337.1 PAS domain-containing protein [Pseudomonadota bacterium]
MTHPSGKKPDQAPKTASLFVRPGLWIVATAIFSAFAAYLHLRGAESSTYAVALSGLALASLVALSWVLGAGGTKNVVTRLLRLAADDCNDGILITDKEDEFLFANQAFHRLLYFAAETGHRGRVQSLDAIERALGEETSRSEFQRLRRIARECAHGRAEISFPTTSGALEWRRLTLSPIAGSVGAVAGGTQWRIEDITSNREVDAVRRQQESYLADYLDLLPAGFFSAGGDGHILFANKTLADWLGVTVKDMVSQPLDSFLADDGSGEATVPMGEGAGDLTFKRLDGGAFRARVVQTVRNDAGGELAYSRSVVLPEADWMGEGGGEVLSGDGSSAIRLHWLFDEAPVGIVLLDLQGNIAECNRAFLDLIGLNPEELIEQPFSERVVLEDRGEIATALSKVVMGTARATHMEIRMPGPRGRDLMASLFASRLENALGEISGLALHFIDTTEHKNLEVQFAQSQKMEAIGQLAGGVAHDFNNLLTAMIGFSDLLLARHGPDDPSFADIQQIRQNANRATNLVRQLLAFSRKQTLAPVRLDITEQLNELSNLLGRLIGEKIDLVMSHGPGLPPIKGDRGQLDQVIINLAVNAKDAMPGGGQLTIRTQALVLDVPVQRGHDLMPKGPYVLIEVADTGTGIRKEEIERIFEPFFSTKEVGSGTGLGLSTVYGIVHQTGGFIFVDSAPGQGTSFSIYLPEYVDDDRPDEVSAVETKATAIPDGDLTGVGTVLLVEDEDAVRMFASRALTNKGYEVFEADNGESALDVINTMDKPIDLIISDVVMPGMDGHTLVQLVRHEQPGVKVILMSGYAEDVFPDEIERDQSIHFLAKPFSLKGLASTVKDVLAE